jgi:HSP20 family protein
MTKWTVQRVPRSVIEKEIEFNRDNLLNTFDRFFDEAFRGQFPDFHKSFGIDPFKTSAFPKVNVVSFDDRVEIEAEIAGYSKDDVSVEVENEVLSIVGKASQLNEQTDKSVYLLRELKRSSFSRSFRLDDQLDADNIEATFKDGLLTLVIPRKKPVEPETKVRKVTIR